MSGYAGRAVVCVCVCLYTVCMRFYVTILYSVCVCVLCGFEMQKQYNSPCLLRKSTEILWKFHSGLHELIIIVYVATGNALAKVTSLQRTDEEETERGKEKCQGRVGLKTASTSKGSSRWGALTDLTEFLSTLASVSHRWCPSIDKRT